MTIRVLDSGLSLCRVSHWFLLPFVQGALYLVGSDFLFNLDSPNLAAGEPSESI